jgi:Sec-independent protein secretion pathway component TatC
MIKYLLEIKNRIFLLILTIITTFLISYVYKEILLFLITQPDRLINKNASYSIFYFIFTDVTEILFIYIKLIIFLNLQVFILFIIYHCFVFFSPAMFKSEYEFLRIFLKVSLTIWVFSVLISNFFLVPITWNFFFSFQELISSKLVNLHFEAKLIEYLEFYISIYYLCVIYFQVFTIFFFFLII